MKNKDKYKTAKERSEAYRATLNSKTSEYIGCELAFAWLDQEAPEEKPLPCPYCGGETRCAEEWNGLFRVVCNKSDCWYSSNVHATEDAAIAAHNKIARLVANAKEETK